MFIELIGTFVGGLAAAGLVMLLNRITGGRLPKWSMPVAAGGAMITMAIWSEYSWYDRTRDTLPEGMEIVTTVESQMFYQPWTYVVPYISRFAAVDQAAIMTNDAAPDLRIARTVFMGRWAPIREVHMIFDCVGQRRADMVEGIELDAQGLPTAETAWFALDTHDPLLKSVCG